MKTFLLILLLTSTLFSAHIDEFAENMKFERDYDIALSKAQKEDKVLMIVISSGYCPWCRKFENKTLSSKLIKSRLDKDVISLIVDKNFDEGDFPDKFKTPFTPRVFFINPKDESILNESRGYIKKKDFLEYLDDANEYYQDEESGDC